MESTLGQQYDVGEKPTVILYTYNNRHARTPEKNSKNKTDNVVHPSHMVVIIYYCMGYKFKATTCMYVCMYVWSSHIAEYGPTG